MHAMHVIHVSEGHGIDSACPSGGWPQPQGTTPRSTGGGPVTCVRLSEGGVRVVYPFGRDGSRSVGVVQVRTDTARNSHVYVYVHAYIYIWQCYRGASAGHRTRYMETNPVLTHQHPHIRANPPAMYPSEG